jgi:hypothetical protein
VKIKIKKKILFLINQNEIYNVIEIAKRLESKFNLIFFITDLYSSYDKLRTSYKILKKKFPKSEIFDYHNELKFLNSKKYDHKINFKFLKKFESKLFSNSIIQNFLKDIRLNNLYGYRDIIYHPKNKKIYYKLINIVSKKINYLFIKNKIKFVYSPDTINFTRNLIREICIIRKIPFYFVSYRIFDCLFLVNLSDIKNFKIMRQNKNKINNYKILEMKKKLINNSNIIEDSKKIIKFKKYILIIFEILLYFSKKFIRNYLNYKKHQISENDLNYFDDMPTLNSNYYWLKKAISIYPIQKYCLEDHEKKLKIIKKNKFIFYPLHVTPEAGVYDQSELYDQLFLIQKISKKLPADTLLVVKPHPSNFKEYTDIEDLDWYKSINKIYNVVLLSHHVNVLYLIKKSLAVISVSGTACLEANLMKKPSFLIGDTEFSGLYGIHNFQNNFFEDIKNFNVKKLYKNNFYFNYIFNESTKMNGYKYADFLTPSEDFASTKGQDAFNFFANKLLKN